MTNNRLERAQIRARKRHHLLLTGQGCICQECNHVYQVDLIIPDELWAKISGGENLLCAECISRRIELASGFAAYHLAASETSALESRLEAVEKERDRWRLALEGLTPQGSEYHNDVERCVKHVRDVRLSQHESIKKAIKRSHAVEKENAELRTENEKFRRMIEEGVGFEDLVDDTANDRL